ncbi:MAG: nucleotidyltransferase family protein [Gemmatimonadales bacterium]
MTLAGVILAAGQSARMGAPKALLDFRGAPFIVRILEAMETLDLKTRLVVLGPDAPRIRPAIAAHDCIITDNPDVDAGPIASLRCALSALKSVSPGGMIVWPVDLPHVRITTVERLIEAWRRSAAPIVVPSFAERRGHPVFWDSRLFAELETSAAADREGARAVVHAHDAEVASVPVDDPAVIDRVNTPEDYERLVREWNRDIY